MVETSKLIVRYEKFGQRVTERMADLDLSLADVHRSFKLRSDKTTYEMVRRYAGGYAMPRQQRMEILADVLQTTPAYLQHGPAEPFDTNVSIAPIGDRRIPLINYVQAGQLTEIGAEFSGDAMEYLLTDLRLSEHAFALEIEGVSMSPEFSPGDRVIIDQEVAPSAGDFVVARNGKQEATFKKYRPRGINERGQDVFELVPINDDFPTLYSDRESLAVIGTMVEHRRYRRR